MNESTLLGEKLEKAGISVNENGVIVLQQKQKKQPQNRRQAQGGNGEAETAATNASVSVNPADSIRRRLAERLEQLKAKAAVDPKDIAVYIEGRSQLQKIEADIESLSGATSDIAMAAFSKLMEESLGLEKEIKAIEIACPDILVEAAKLEVRQARETEAEKVRQKERDYEEARKKAVEQYLIPNEELSRHKKYAAKPAAIFAFFGGKTKESHIFIPAAGSGSEVMISRIPNDDESSGFHFCASRTTSVEIAEKVFRYEKDGQTRWAPKRTFELPNSRDLSGVWPRALREILSAELRKQGREYSERKQEQECRERLSDISQTESPITWAELRLGEKGVCPVSTTLNWKWTDESGRERRDSLVFQFVSTPCDGKPGFMLRAATPSTKRAAQFLETDYGKPVPVEKLQADKRLQVIYNLNQPYEVSWKLKALGEEYDADLLYDDGEEVFSADNIGIYAVQGDWNDRDARYEVGIVFEREGTEIKIVKTVPGYSEQLFKELVGKSFKITEMPSPLRLFLRRVYCSLTRAKSEEVPAHLNKTGTTEKPEADVPVPAA